MLGLRFLNSINKTKTMILIPRNDEIVRIAISVKDMGEQPDEITVTNRQTKDVYDFYLTDISTDERCGIYQIYNIRNTTPTPIENVTYISLSDGSYDYVFGSEIGLFQIGIPSLQKVEYTQQQNNYVYYGQ